jgi:hypothetical protein
MTRNSMQRLPVVAISVLVVLLALAAGWAAVRGNPRIISSAAFQHERITPNADGDTDATAISYRLTRNADIAIFFVDEAGQRYYFRTAEPRSAGEYQVLFSGVVDGYRLPDDTVQGEIVARLLRDGIYTWTLEATAADGQTDRESGRLEIAGADPELPELRNFTLDRHLFTPNQDGIDDRVLIQFFLPKEVVDLRVFVVTPEGNELPISEQERETPANQPGRHYYDYEGGVDNKENPPPDGTYPIVATAQDAEGQRVRVEDRLMIQFGGVPRAEIISPAIGDTLALNTTAVVLCDTLTFSITVENYGTTPIRTTGPAPGATYDSDWNYNTLGWPTESGAWRVAIGYENEISNYPFRWALGQTADLEKIGEHYYLMPGARAVVTGSIRVVGPFGDRNPQPMWAGLIHEDVEIALVNNRVDPHEIMVEMPAGARTKCEPREIPAAERPD